MTHAYYNEIDVQKAAWLRELIAAGVICPGDVDTRDVRDVRPSDLKGYHQVHAFAGIGIWSYSLRLAGWPDDRPVWTGSCPCGPFSSAGKRKGFADERHLWPFWHHLIRICRPGVVFGEQVASRDGLAWLDLVFPDMEGEAYTFAALDLCASGFGAPNIRQRLFFVADAEGGARGLSTRRSHQGEVPDADRHGETVSVADTGRGRVQSERGLRELGGATAEGTREGDQRERFRFDARDGGADGGVADTGKGGRRSRQRRLRATGGEPDAVRGGEAGELGDSAMGGRGVGRHETRPGRGGHADGADAPSSMVDAGGTRLPHGELEELRRAWWRQEGRAAPESGPTNGFWRNAEWLYCRDEKYRPVEPGTFPLAHGSPARILRLRGYGDGINAETAAAFIETYVQERYGVVEA